MQQTATFSANQLKFIDWLATGKYKREPSTEQEFANKIGVNRSTLSRWKKGQNGFTKEDFWEAVTARARDLNREHLAIVYEALRAEAMKGSYQHIKLMLELSGEYTERREVLGTMGLIVDWDDDNDADLEG